MPADEGLDAEHRAVLEAHERLVVQLELVAVQRTAQAARLERRRSGVGAAGPPATACPSRPHSFARYIAMSARFRRSPAVVGVPGERGDPDARAGVDVDARDATGGVSASADTLGQRDRVVDGGRALGRLDVGEEDEELVAALTGDRVGLARTVSQSRPATARSSSSPAAWPKSSLTSLKSSRSTKRTATCVPARRDRARARSRCSVSIARFGRPVSASWKARCDSSASSCLRCADVEDRAVQQRDLAALVGRPAALLVDPPDRAVGVQDAVVDREGLVALDRRDDRALDLAAVVGVDDALVGADGVADEVRRRVTGDVLDLAAHEPHLPVGAQLAAVDRPGDVGHHILEPLVEVHLLRVIGRRRQD